MKKRDIDNINGKIDLIEKTLNDDVPMITMPIFSYEAKEERHAKEKRALIKTIVFLICVILAIISGFLLFCSQFEVVTDDASTNIEAEQSGDFNAISGGDMEYGIPKS